MNLLIVYKLIDSHSHH